VALLGAPMPLIADPPSHDRDRAEEEVEFGIVMAHRALWNEATYRFERAMQLDPPYAPGFNNLAVAYDGSAGSTMPTRCTSGRARWIPTTTTSDKITSCSSKLTGAAIGQSDSVVNSVRPHDNISTSMR
jgi:hypothetical protein